MMALTKEKFISTYERRMSMERISG